MFVLDDVVLQHVVRVNRAPRQRVSQVKELLVAELQSGQRGLLECLLRVLAFDPLLVGDLGDSEAPVIGDVLPQGDVPVHVEVFLAQERVAGVLIPDAVRGLVEGLDGLVVVERFEEAFLVVLNAHIVECVRDLVS